MGKIKFRNNSKNVVVSNNVRPKQSLSEIFSQIASGVTGVWTFILLVVFPLYTHDMYFDILGARYVFFKIWGLTLIIFLVMLGILYIILDYTNTASAPSALERFLDSFKIDNIKKHINITDIFFGIMIVAMALATIGTKYKEEAFFGNSGRYQGLECWLIYFGTYVAVTRTFKFKRIYLDLALLAGVMSCLWGIFDFYTLDPFAFFRNVAGIQRSMFASSVGNLNTFTNYTIIILGISGSLYLIEKSKIKQAFYLIVYFISVYASICGISDNAVLAFAGFFIFVPFVNFKNIESIFRYFILIILMLLSFTLIRLSLVIPHNPYATSFFFDLINKNVDIYLLIPLVVITLIAFLALVLLGKRESEKLGANVNYFDNKLNSKFYRVYNIILIVVFVLITYILLDMNVFKQNVNLWRQIPSSNQLIFNDDWGTHRGHNWRIAFTNFTQNFNWFQRLFGFGADSYLVVSETTFYEEMVNRYGEVYDSAHNEYVNYLICEGLVGLIAYLGIFVTAIKNGIKYASKNIFIIAPVVAVVCYMVQAVVNIAIPITTPIFFILMYMCASREYLKENA